MKSKNSLFISVGMKLRLVLNEVQKKKRFKYYHENKQEREGPPNESTHPQKSVEEYNVNTYSNSKRSLSKGLMFPIQTDHVGRYSSMQKSFTSNLKKNTADTRAYFSSTTKKEIEKQSIDNVTPNVPPLQEFKTYNTLIPWSHDDNCSYKQTDSYPAHEELDLSMPSKFSIFSQKKEYYEDIFQDASGFKRNEDQFKEDCLYKTDSLGSVVVPLGEILMKPEYFNG